MPAAAVSYAADGIALRWIPGRLRLTSSGFACDVECEGQPISRELLKILGCCPRNAVTCWTRLEVLCKLRDVPILEAVQRRRRRLWFSGDEDDVRIKTVLVEGKVCSFGVTLSKRSICHNEESDDWRQS